MRALLIHGRAQGGKDRDALREEWIETLRRGFAAASRPFPVDVEFDLPFYGDDLDAFTRRVGLPSPDDVVAKGPGGNREFERFMQRALGEIKENDPRLSDAEVTKRLDDRGSQEKGVANWHWVQAIARTIDEHWTEAADFTIETFLKDVFLYLENRRVRLHVDRIVAGALTDEPTVVVGHSLGSVVGYNVIGEHADRMDLVKYVTVGSPLGIRAISGKLGIPRNLAPRGWYNAYDEGDIVALNPLDERYFPTDPAIENDGRVQNPTPNQHGIVGYLDDVRVVSRIAEALRG